MIHARQPSTAEPTVVERVQPERLTWAKDSTVAERHGALFGPGATTLELDRGFYVLRTLSDASLVVSRGGVDARVITNDKDPFPDGPAETSGGDPKPPVTEGDEPVGELPRFSVVAR